MPVVAIGVASRMSALTSTYAAMSKASAANPRTILLVDDEAIITMATGMILSDLGYRVLEAYSGAQAMNHLNSATAIDLLITDYSMPGMRGDQVARAGRDLRPGLPVLITTGRAEVPGEPGAGIRTLRKPYTVDQLRAEIDILLAVEAIGA